MANPFAKDSQQYADGRPSYPAKLFEYIASKTPARDLAWDVGTGTGQAAQSLATRYTTVIATDTSQELLDLAIKLPNIHYRQTSSIMSIAEVEQKVGQSGTVDLVIVAQTLHWLDLPSFYRNVRWVLKKPHGVIAAWCYSMPKVNDAIDAVLRRIYTTDFGPYWEANRKLVDEEYKTIEFPFEEVDGEKPPRATELAAEKVMEFEDYLTFLRSWSAYEKAKDLGVELLTNEVIGELKRAWNEDGNKGKKLAKFPIYLRIGKVGNNNNNN